MKKRVLSLALALVMVLSLCPTAAFAAEYTDIEGHWGKAAIERWTDYGIVEGDGSEFSPDESMTRGQMAKVLSNLLGLETEADISGYSDVPAGQWYRSYMAKCVAAGIFQGVSDDRLAPEEPVTREQMFVLLGRALGIAPVDTTNKQFSDGEQVSDWAQGYVNALANRNIVSGVGDNRVAPQIDIDRASVMALLDKAITTYVNTNGQTVAAEGGIVLVNAANVTVTGEADNVVVAGTNSNVALSGANVTDVAVVGEDNTVSLTDGATAATVTVTENADSAKVNVAAGSTVSTVASAADGVTVAGSGTVEKAEVSGSNTAVNTKGTELTASENASGTTQNGKPVESGTTVETKPATPSGSGSSSSSGGGSSTPSTVASTTTFSVMDGDLYNSINWAGKPATLDAMQTGVNFGTADAQNNVAVTGTLKYVEGFTGFNTTTPEQEGNYLALMFSVPAEATDEGTITLVKGHEGASDKSYTVGTPGAVDTVGTAKYFALVQRVASASSTVQIKIDWDGTGSKFTESTYTLTFTGATLEAKEDTPPTPADVPVESVTMATSAALEITDSSNTITLTATVEPDNATDKTVTWTSSDETVATVANGVVTGLKAGTATITATAVGDSSKKAECVVTVTDNSTPDAPSYSMSDVIKAPLVDRTPGTALDTQDEIAKITM